MKPILLILLTVFALHSEAQSIRDIIPILIGGGGGRPAPYPGGGGGGRPAPYPGNPYPGQPYPGQPYNPGYPTYPSQPYPGDGAVSCRADDRGWEEHGGGHYSCGECLRYHGECIETCSANTVEVRVEGTDQYGRVLSFIGRGPDQWRAQDDALRNCQYSNAWNCRVVNYQQRQDVVSRRNCR